MSLKCPFCDNVVAETIDTFRQNYINFYTVSDDRRIFYENAKRSDFDLMINKLKCPNCEKTSYDVQGLNNDYEHIQLPIHPLSNARALPEYIPTALREDYEEAYRIVHLSPKASATLSRRCLQGMIRHFFKTYKKTLNDEINAIEHLVSSDQKSVLHSLRKIGNVGAHLERNVNLIVEVSSEDAEKLLRVLEYFFDEWYISKHNTEQLFLDIANIEQDIQKQKKSK